MSTKRNKKTKGKGLTAKANRVVDPLRAVSAVDRGDMANMRYVTGIPRKPLPEGRVLVHNHIVPPQRVLGANGFRAWTQDLTDDLEPCGCDWAGVDLRGLTHYRVKRAWENGGKA